MGRWRWWSRSWWPVICAIAVGVTAASACSALNHAEPPDSSTAGTPPTGAGTGSPPSQATDNGAGPTGVPEIDNAAEHLHAALRGRGHSDAFVRCMDHSLAQHLLCPELEEAVALL